jgi:hypothetical protein
VELKSFILVLFPGSKVITPFSSSLIDITSIIIVSVSQELLNQVTY